MGQHKWTNKERKWLKNNYNLNIDRKELLLKFNLIFNNEKNMLEELIYAEIKKVIFEKYCNIGQKYD